MIKVLHEGDKFFWVAVPDDEYVVYISYPETNFVCQWMLVITKYDGGLPPAQEEVSVTGRTGASHSGPPELVEESASKEKVIFGETKLEELYDKLAVV